MELNDVKFDRKAMERLKKKIVSAENNNLRQKKLSDPQMVNKIKQWIEEDVKCYSNQ